MHSRGSIDNPAAMAVASWFLAMANIIVQALPTHSAAIDACCVATRLITVEQSATN